MADQFNAGSNNTVNAGAKQADYAGLGLAVTSLVLGIISIPFSLVLIGGVCGLVGLILAIIHLRKKYLLRSMAWWGLSLSITGLLATTALLIYYIGEVRQIQETMATMEAQSYEEWIGAEAPDITLKDIEGNPIVLSSLKGRRVILDFWATWCPPCRMETPHFIKLRNMYDVNDLAIIGISSEDEKILRSFRDKKRINYSLALEKDLPSPYADVTALPTTFFIDRNGIIRYVVDGYHDFEELNVFVLGLDRKDNPNE